MAYHYLMKYLLVGDSSVGKSCVLMRFIEDRFDAYRDLTVGVEFGTRNIDIKGTRIKLQIWDTAGQERFRSITRSYYRSAAGCLLVYDVSSRQTFENIHYWLEDARQNSTESVVMILVGNKSDLKDQREVSKEEGEKFAKGNGLLFCESSAKTGQNIREIFYRIAETVLRKLESEEIQVSSDYSGVATGTLYSPKSFEKKIKLKEKINLHQNTDKGGGCCGGGKNQEI